jgi:acyl carrier protein
MEENPLQQEIFALICDRQGIELKDISLDKSLNFDLGVDGDDAVELFEAYAEQFQVDISALGQEWDRYFGPEAGFSLFGVGKTLTLFGGKHNPMLPLPISRLVDSARAGKWIPLSE